MIKIFLTTLLVVTACGGSIAERTNKSLSTALLATDSARDQFTKWDAQHQLEIVNKAASREQAETDLASYREKRQKIIQSFTVAYTSMASAAAMVPLVVAGEKKDRDLIALLISAVAAVQSVVSTIKEIREAFDATHETPPARKPVTDPPPVSDPAPQVTVSARSGARCRVGCAHLSYNFGVVR